MSFSKRQHSRSQTARTAACEAEKLKQHATRDQQHQIIGVASRNKTQTVSSLLKHESSLSHNAACTELTS